MKTSEALPQFRAHQGDAGVNPELGLRSTHLGSGIHYSPLGDCYSTTGPRPGYRCRL
ncbi:hypothetical protein [Acidovorax sp. Root217]|uniref:hypothetical protein n=1 Tax=Acidovorax sp. Root217 TaxID=1736492 RepID=UPI001F3D284D|nr:hypothetical protein [Acidovorax sp. Root217]